MIKHCKKYNCGDYWLLFYITRFVTFLSGQVEKREKNKRKKGSEEESEEEEEEEEEESQTSQSQQRTLR